MMKFVVGSKDMFLFLVSSANNLEKWPGSKFQCQKFILTGDSDDFCFETDVATSVYLNESVIPFISNMYLSDDCVCFCNLC